MHTALQMAPVLAAEKSHVPFYIAGGILVLWALVISMLVGMRSVSFPEDDTQQRVVMGITVVLVAATLVAAVATSGGSAEKTATAAEPASTGPTETAPSSAQPTATTGTPAPPSSPAAKTTVTKLTQAADPGGQLAYEKQELTAKAGTVQITFANASPVEHNLTIEQNKKVLGGTPTFVGGTRTLVLKLQPGTYTFYCSVPGHRQAGMEGKLKVVP